MTAVEANYDGLVGPTHNYAGLSYGNIASATHEGAVSNPRRAVLQGLAQMKMLADLGLVQGVLPPQERPAIWRLRELGFAGGDAAVLEAAWATDPRLVARVSSASPMWAANAATVSPSADAADGRVHLSPANLLTTAHRAIEHGETQRALAAAFPDGGCFEVHPALPAQSDFADEGAANHMRLCASHGEPGVEIFVYGRSAFEEKRRSGFPARQTLEACQALARRAGLDPRRTVFVRQSDEAIDAGAFHNDVVAVSAETVMFFHERAFADKARALEDIGRAAEGLFEPQFIEVTEAEVNLDDAVKSYLFNSQLLRPSGWDRFLLLAPQETQETASTRALCEGLVEGQGPIGEVRHVDLRESMRNGGGPACLRLRVVLTEAERAAANPHMLFDDALHDELKSWAERRYRDALRPGELGDPALMTEAREALDELTSILELGGGHYPFQRA
ncbi:MAG: N-succinylarginine dihydrolase [Maricaulaceae bacterium]|jgi:succinylarginine dihydrolase